MRYVLGSRASIGGVLGSGRGGAAAAWYLAGGVSAANCVAAYAPIGAASLAASYTNLANPGMYTAAPGVAPTFDASTGWIGDGTRYLTTGIVPANTWSLIVRFSGMESAPGDKIALSAVRSGSAFWGIYNQYATSKAFLMNGSATTYTVSAGSGVWAIAGAKGYINGTHVSTAAGTYSGASGLPVMCAFDGSSYYYQIVGNIQAVAIYNVTLSAPQVAAISAAMAAL